MSTDWCQSEASPNIDQLRSYSICQCWDINDKSSVSYLYTILTWEKFAGVLMYKIGIIDK